jgi:DNA primase
MNDFIRVKSELDIKKVILSELSMEMPGKHLPTCPFCGGKECFSIREAKQDFHCFQCAPEAHGDVFVFLERFHNLDKAGALRRAAEIAGIKLEEKAKRKPALTKTDQIRLEAADYYHARALELGKEYFLKLRGHLPATMVQEKLGWSDGRLLDHLRSKGFTNVQVVESGLAREKEIEGGTRILDFFSKGLAVFPHFSHGRVLHFTQKDPRDVPKEQKLKFQMTGEQRDKRWFFYGQDALERYEEVILLEGEHDRLQVVNSGLGYVLAMIGQISDGQLKALESRCRGKVLYLWMDNDKAGYGYVRKICRALSEITIRIIIAGKEGDDPDCYLRDFEGDRKREIKRLQQEAPDYIAWEIHQAAGLGTLAEKLNVLKEHDVFHLISQQTAIHQDVFKEKLLELGFSEKAVDQAMDASEDLKTLIHEHTKNLEKPSYADPDVLANIIFTYFSKHGRFYRDATDTIYLIHMDVTYEISNNAAFNSLMHHMTELIYTRAPAVSVWEALRNKAYRYGRRITKARWIHTEDVKNTIYLNLNSANNNILKISLDSIAEIKNGMNPEHVLLSSSRRILPFNFLPDTEIQDGVLALKELVMDNLCCEPKQRYFILCWLFSAFLLDYVPSQAHMKFSGSSGGGKTSAAKLLTALLYGSDHISDPTAAAAYSMASQNPLLVVDNLESRDVTRGMQKFLLDSATRGEKNKRLTGTSSDIADEAPRALVCITAIEPFTLPELINRTYDIWFDYKSYGNEGYYETEIIRGIKRKRDLILSAMLKFTQSCLLPNIDTCHDFVIVLRKDFKGHSKERSNEFLALLMMILEKLMEYLPLYGPDDLLYKIESGEKEIRDAWISEQNRKSRDTEVSSNNILKLLDGLVREYLLFLREKKVSPEWKSEYSTEVFVLDHPEYGMTMIKTKPEEITDQTSGEKYTRSYIEFVAQSKDIVAVFDRFCRNNGLRNPYESAAVFGARLRNDMGMMKKGGWELVTKEGKDGPYFRSVKGVNYFKFRNTLIR